MWPFKKPKLNGNLIFLVAYRNSDYEMDISQEFAKTLTRKQIKMLNKTCDFRHDDFHCDTELLKEQEKQAEKDRIKVAADSKRKDGFEEKDHNLNGSPYDSDSEYAQFVKNNAEKMLLTDDEEKKLLKTFADFHDRIMKAQDELAKKPHTISSEENLKEFADMFLKSASNGNKK
jgi:ABC-type branched-subunit amino acid transport system substrate-binding protein